MKKTFLLVFCLLFIGITQAQIKIQKIQDYQASQKSRWEIGIHGGAVLSTIKDYDKNSTTKAFWGYSMGLTTQYQLTKNWYFSPQFNLIRKGVKANTEIHNVTETHEKVYKYDAQGNPISVERIDTIKHHTDLSLSETVSMVNFEVPLLLTYQITLAPNWQVAVQGGPYLSYGLFGRYQIVDKRTPNVPQFSGDTYGKKYDQRLDIGLRTGLYMTYRKHFILGVNYAHGMTSMKKTIDKNELQPKTRSWGLTIGYMF